MDIKYLEQILELLKQNDIADFELNEEGMQLKLARAKQELRLVAAPQSHVLEPAFAQVAGAAQSGSNKRTFNFY